MSVSKKWSWLAILVLLFTFVLAGCSSSSKGNGGNAASNQSSETASKKENPLFPGVDISKEVKLKMYLLGDKPKDFDLVYTEVNKLLKADINATVDVSFMSWADWQQKYPLVFASGEDFDLIYTSNWAQYNSQATKGGFLELTKDMLQKYAPKTAANMYPDAWEQAKLNGKVYMLPQNYKEIQGVVGLVRGDIMDKYGLTVKSIDDLPAYFDAAKKENILPFNPGSDLDWSGQPLIRNWSTIYWNKVNFGPLLSPFVYDFKDKSGKAQLFYNLPDYISNEKMTKKFLDSGYWSKSALVNKVPNKDSFVSGKSAFGYGNIGSMNTLYITTLNEHPEWKVQAVDLSQNLPIDIMPFTQNGMALNARSNNPERSLMMLDLFRNDPRYYNLTQYGIEGKHYELTSDGKQIKPLADSVNFPPNGACPWGWNSDELTLTTEGGLPNYDELRNGFLERAGTNPLQAFNFSDVNVKNEMANINNVITQYGKPLDFGMVDDVDSAVKTFQQKLKEAGIDKVQKELDTQISEYLKTQSK